MPTNFTSVDDYIALQPPAAQGVLERVRRIIRKSVPEAEETISYQIPAYKLRGARLLFFAGWKHHYSLYPVNDALLSACQGDPGKYQVSKGTIRFPLSEPIPAKLIERIAKFRAREAREHAKGTPAAPKKRAGNARQKV